MPAAAFSACSPARLSLVPPFPGRLSLGPLSPVRPFPERRAPVRPSPAPRVPAQRAPVQRAPERPLLRGRLLRGLLLSGAFLRGLLLCGFFLSLFLPGGLLHPRGLLPVLFRLPGVQAASQQHTERQRNGADHQRALRGRRRRRRRRTSAQRPRHLGIARQQTLDRFRKPVAERLLLDPLLVGEHVLQPARGLRSIDAQRIDRLAALRRQLHLAQHVLAAVRRIGEQQQHRAAAIDRRHDLVLVARAHRDIARREPAGDAAIFEIGHERARRGGVGRGVADEQIVLHAASAPVPAQPPMNSSQFHNTAPPAATANRSDRPRRGVIRFPNEFIHAFTLTALSPARLYTR